MEIKNLDGMIMMIRKKLSLKMMLQFLMDDFILFFFWQFLEEYYRLYAEQKRREEEEKRRKEEEERLAREAEERERKEMEELEAAMMGDSVMRYLKMVRRNSKTSDQVGLHNKISYMKCVEVRKENWFLCLQKKAERFRSMNYDPTLRNIKAKYLNKEEIVLGYKKSFEVQVCLLNTKFSRV